MDVNLQYRNAIHTQQNVAKILGPWDILRNCNDWKVVEVCEKIWVCWGNNNKINQK